MSQEPRRCRIGDLELEAINDIETTLLEDEMKSYFLEGITLQPHDCVIDAGANFGAFSATAHQQLNGQLRILAFEPMLPVFDVLKRNFDAHFSGLGTAFPFGLGDREADIDALYYPAMSTFSSACLHPEAPEDKRARVTRAAHQLVREGRAFIHLQALPTEFAEAIIEGEIRHATNTQTHRVKIRTLSSVLDENAVEEVGLLKIDVEGAELDVLQGIAAQHWPIIRQVVLEVEEYSTREPEVRALLRKHGYEVSSRQDAVQAAGNYGMVYARR